LPRYRAGIGHSDDVEGASALKAKSQRHAMSLR
jgi:hypothetical protein